MIAEAAIATDVRLRARFIPIGGYFSIVQIKYCNGTPKAIPRACFLTLGLLRPKIMAA
jgi:hypothetical protein